MSRSTGGVPGGAGVVSPMAPQGGPGMGDESSERRRPGVGVGVLKLVLGLGGLGLACYVISEAIFRGMDRPEPWAEYLIVAAVGLGLGVAFFLSGGMNLVGRRLGWVRGIVLALVVAGGVYLTVPKVYQTRRTAKELAAWERLQASPKLLGDYKRYREDAPFARKGVKPTIAVMELREELVKMEGEKSGKVEKLRMHLWDFRNEMKRGEDPEYQKAIDVAREGMGRVYAKALEDLAERLEAESGGKKPEFPEDPGMRAAFAAVLARVAKSDDNRVYLEFSSENHLAALGVEKTPDLEGTAPRPSPAARAGHLPLVDQGEAFSPEREGERQYVFKNALEGALRKAFSEPLVNIETLKEGEDRKDKVVFQAHCSARRVPGEMILTREDKPVGRLFKIEVTWQFSVFDADGKLLTKNTSRSIPAESIRFSYKPTDPLWAPYSIMMDSAYYNYCREVTGRLGMIPPEVQEYFVF